MKVTIEPVVSYRVTIDGKQCAGTFRKHSEWEGMIKLVGPAGGLIVSLEDDQNFFERLLNKEEVERRGRIVRASDSLLPDESEKA